MPTPEQGWLHTSEDGPLDLTLDRCCDAARTDDERRFHRFWRGEIHTVNNVAEALACLVRAA